MLKHVRQGADDLPLLIDCLAADEVADVHLILCKLHGMITVDVQLGATELLHVLRRGTAFQCHISKTVMHTGALGRNGKIGFILLAIKGRPAAKVIQISSVGLDLCLAVNALGLQHLADHQVVVHGLHSLPYICEKSGKARGLSRLNIIESRRRRACCSWQ